MVHHLMRELARGRMTAEEFQSGEDPCPGNEVVLLHHHIEMGKQQMDIRSAEDIDTGDLEMGHTKHLTHLVGIGIKGHYHRNGLIGIGLIEIFYSLCHLLTGFHKGFTAYQLHLTGRLDLPPTLLVRSGEQVLGDTQLLFTIGVVDIQQVLRRTVVDIEIMQTSGSATLPQHVQGIEFRSHEREDGLLRIAQIDHRGILGSEQVDDS